MRLELKDVHRPEHLVFEGGGAHMWMNFVMDVAPRDGGSLPRAFRNLNSTNGQLSPVVWSDRDRTRFGIVGERRGQIREMSRT
jgi:hypothetical protein